MGLADLMIMLKVPYASEKAELLAELIAKFITGEARAMSRRMAAERGPFPAFPKAYSPKPESPRFVMPLSLRLRQRAQ